jgi:hypothetical protein
MTPLVPTLRVGTHCFATLLRRARVALLLFQGLTGSRRCGQSTRFPRGIRSATQERREAGRSHAERGNEK